MNHVNIWYLTDYDEGKDVAKSVERIGLNVHVVEGPDFFNKNIDPDGLHLFVVDLKEENSQYVMNIFSDDNRMHNHTKYAILDEDKIEEGILLGNNILHLEFIGRPVNKREFALLMEKSVMIEKYRETMRFISRESQDRIDAYESLLHIHKKDLFEDGEEKNTFEKIIQFERNIIEEQSKLNNAIKEFSLLRQKDIYEMKKLIDAEQMLDILQEKELKDAKSVIYAQEAALNFSNIELKDCKNIMNAFELNDELSREEAIRLHDEIKRLSTENNTLKKENEKYRREIMKLKGVS